MCIFFLFISALRDVREQKDAAEVISPKPGVWLGSNHGEGPEKWEYGHEFEMNTCYFDGATKR